MKPGGNVQPDLVRAVTADDIECGLDLIAVDRLRIARWRANECCGPTPFEVVKLHPDHQPGYHP